MTGNLSDSTDNVENHSQLTWTSPLLIAGVYLPLLTFTALAIAVWQSGEGFWWDVPILKFLHATAQPGLDRFAGTLTQAGSWRGILPISIIVGLVLLYRRRWRSLSYWSITLLGSAGLNWTIKRLFHRGRPHLWDPFAPELDFAFPSGHAMLSMGLVAALVMLVWNSRWCWWTLVAGSLLVGSVGWTRLYLGVHYWR
jgi:membrane-associated phospholipid phosphatase